MNSSSNVTPFDPNIHAELVYDGGGAIHAPGRLGTPNADQLQGTPLEQLAELAGRVCYDSLGAAKARGSLDYHVHIQDVGHLSVYEHAQVSVLFGAHSDAVRLSFVLGLLGRPGVYVRQVRTDEFAVTFNLRAALEVTEWRPSISAADPYLVAAVLRNTGRTAAPMVVTPLHVGHPNYWSTAWVPETDEEKWITLFMCGSRGMSHELVRHGDFTAISQRSTRYVDESESPWVEHPLIRSTGGLGFPPSDPALTVIPVARGAYESVRGTLEHRLRGLGVDPAAARKQARGAARGYLGNALYTEVIFSASVAQWRRMLRMRCSDAADAEIRVLFAKALQELKRSRYGDRFADLMLRPATDGIGEVLI